MTTRHKDVFAAAAAGAVRAGLATVEAQDDAPDEEPPPADDTPVEAPSEPPQPSEQDLSATDDASLATGRHSVTHNKHDVGALEGECNQLSAAIAGLGAQLDQPTIQQRAQSYAAMKMLVDRGICTEAEAQAAVLTEIRSMLASILQQVEVQRLQQQQAQQGGPQVQAVRKPDLILPASHTMRRHQD